MGVWAVVVHVCLAVLCGMLYSVVGGWQLEALLFHAGCNLEALLAVFADVCSAEPVGCVDLCLHVPKSHKGVVCWHANASLSCHGNIVYILLRGGTLGQWCGRRGRDCV